MSLYWVIRKGEGGRRLFYLQEAGTPLDAAYKTNDAEGFAGSLTDVIPLDNKTKAHIKDTDIGHVLSIDDARDIIENR
jgi:hypothetical protein